jgi:alkyl hydroperoxide reductase subunit AhpC
MLDAALSGPAPNLQQDVQDNHIEKAQGQKVNNPMIGEFDLKVAKLYGMLPADASDSCMGRTDPLAVGHDNPQGDLIAQQIQSATSGRLFVRLPA